MNIIKTILTTTLVLAASNLSAADKMRVLDRGLDGNQRTYQVVCPNGNTGSITKHFSFTEVEDPEELSRKRNAGHRPSGAPATTTLSKVCVSLQDGEEECKTSWEIENAAKTSCAP
jgi:hypothetical protein